MGLVLATYIKPEAEKLHTLVEGAGQIERRRSGLLGPRG
jgi:hypothetical protein